MTSTPLILAILLGLSVAVQGSTTAARTPLDATWTKGEVFLCPCVRERPQDRDEVAAQQQQRWSTQ